MFRSPISSIPITAIEPESYLRNKLVHLFGLVRGSEDLAGFVLALSNLEGVPVGVAVSVPTVKGSVSFPADDAGSGYIPLGRIS